MERTGERGLRMGEAGAPLSTHLYLVAAPDGPGCEPRDDAISFQKCTRGRARNTV
jgi:hypothetical protein